MRLSKDERKLTIGAYSEAYQNRVIEAAKARAKGKYVESEYLESESRAYWELLARAEKFNRLQGEN